MICQIIIEITLSESNIDEIIISETLCKPLLFTSISNLLTFPLTSIICHLQSIAELVDSSIPSVCHDQPLPCSDLTSGDCLQRKEVEAMMVRSHHMQSNSLSLLDHMTDRRKQTASTASGTAGRPAER